MTYQVRITSRAQEDIDMAADYIGFVLKNPQASDALIEAAEEEIASLSNMPERYALVRDDVLASWGIRCTRIKNYLAFFTVDQVRQTVYVIRFLYGKSSWSAILRSDAYRKSSE